MSAGKCKVHGEFTVNVSLSRAPCPIHLAQTWQQVLPGCEGTPTQCIWISHTCPASSAGQGWRNKTMGRKDEKRVGERERVCWGTAGCWRLFHWLFISLAVKFIYQLSTLCFVSLLYAQYKVTINSIWGWIKKNASAHHIFCLPTLTLRKLQKALVQIDKRSWAFKQLIIQH